MKTVINVSTQEIIKQTVTPEEILEMKASSEENSEQNVRNKRDAFLAQSDWTQVSDAPVDQSAWATYRQSLRDIPQQAGFPSNVVWPTKPQ